MFGCLTCDDNFNYYIDQSRMITFIVLEANLAGAADEHLPYPPSGESLSKADNSTDLDRHIVRLTTNVVTSVV